MPERGFITGFWTDAFIVKLPFEAKSLYAYLFTNDHCNQAGLYEIGLETIASETKLPESSLPELFSLLEPKIKWYPDHNLVWVKNFIKRQSKSPKFLIAVAKSLATIHNNGAIAELLDYNLERYSISIPYPYTTSTVSIPSSAGAISVSVSDKEDRVVKGKGKSELADISQLYEENIGQITPIVAERLKDIAERYPPGWFGEALNEAVARGARNLKYIEAILERWKVEGFKAPKKGGAVEQRPGKGVRPKPEQARRRPITRIRGDEDSES
ncbi:MAG TPA: DnaD domain protein [Dehalococcoidia bacterium]|nr:DnaD domain protein [Dehalococcoidia bacterium]